MDLRQVTEAADYRISGGVEFTWTCYGPDARYLDFDTKIGAGTAYCIYDAKNQFVYEVGVDSGERTYRWIDPQYVAAHDSESQLRAVIALPGEAKDVVVELEDDILEKLHGAAAVGTFDSRVLVPLTIPDDMLFMLMKMAHEKDVTLNTLVEQMLVEELDRLESIAA